MVNRPSFVGKKVFAMCSNNHHNDGHIAVTIPTAIGVQAALIESDAKKFYKPPYVGVRGWVGIELKQVSDAELISLFTGGLAFDSTAQTARAFA